VRTLLSRYLDLQGPVKRELVAVLAHYATNAEERRRLAHLASREGKDDLAKWAHDSKRAVAEVFLEFASLRVPLEAFAQLLPRLQPRAYTICTSARVQPRRVGVVATVVDEVKPGADKTRRLRGVCTGYMTRWDGEDTCLLGDPVDSHARFLSPPPLPRSARAVGTTVWAHVKTSSFRLPPDPTTPIICVGPGTGIAPMRAFLQERAAMASEGVRLGPALLFFGCRSEREDYIYRDELAAWQSGAGAGGGGSALTELHTAFSRDQPAKVYVQHRLQEQGARVADLVQRGGAHVYVCGATAMGQDVGHALERVLAAHGVAPLPAGGGGDGDGVAGGALGEAGAKALLADMHRNGRYVQELWS